MLSRERVAASFPAVLTALTLAFIVFSVWELVRLRFFTDLASPTVHWLYISRGAASSAILAAWAIWYVLRSRARSEGRVHRAETKCRGLLESLPDALVSLDAAGRIDEWNPGAERLFGLKAAAVRGRTLADLGEEWAPELSNVVDAAASGRSLPPFLTRRKTHEGTLRDLEFQVTAMRAEGAVPAGCAVLARDVTESRRMEARVREVEKLAGVGRLAAGIAHQLGSPLSTIGLNAQMIAEGASDRELEQDARVIVDASRHCRTVVSELLRFARPSGGERRRLSLGPVVEAALHLVEAEIKKAGIRLRCETDLHTEVMVDANQIEQVLLNLLTNARQATPSGGEIRVKLSGEGSGGVVLEVRDSGRGIAEADLPRVFEPFFTTREAAGGTGLGLAVCYGIVREHGGTLSVESAPGRGASFSVWLPPADGVSR